MKYFLSQPMHGKTEEEIRYNTKRCVELIAAIDPDFKWIDSLYFPKESDFPEGITETGKRLFCLGRSITKLAEAEAIVFDGCCYTGPDKSKGCATEYEIAQKYNIPIYVLLDNKLFKEPDIK